MTATRSLRALVLEGGYDLVHVHGPLPSIVCRLASGEVPTVTTSHTPWGSLHPLTRLGWRATARLDAASVAVSGAVAASLPTRDPTVVIPHGVDPARCESVLRSASPRSTEGPVTAITIASHRDAKNYPNLLRALRTAVDLGSDLRLLAVGEGPSLDAHRELAQDLGLGDRVAFEAPTLEALERIASADILVVASDYEGQPLVVSEALALGRPVVATAVGRIPEMVSPFTGRVVRPRDPTVLGEALAEVAGDAVLREKMGEAARAHAFEWTLDDALEAHVALYASVIR